MHRRLRRGDDSGVSLIELVVAILLLSLIALSFVPLLVNGLRLTNLAASITTAGAIANDRLDAARATTGGCVSISTLRMDPVADNRGGIFTPSIEVQCPASYPGIADVTVRVSDRLGEVLAVRTLVFVQSES